MHHPNGQPETGIRTITNSLLAGHPLTLVASTISAETHKPDVVVLQDRTAYREDYLSVCPLWVGCGKLHSLRVVPESPLIRFSNAASPNLLTAVTLSCFDEDEGEGVQKAVAILRVTQS